MKITELTAIAARIFAICLFLYGLRQVAGLAGYIGPAMSGELSVSLLFYVVVAFVPLLIAATIWAFPITVSRIFLPNDIQSREIKVSEESSFLSAAFVVLGVYVLTYAIPDFLYHVTKLYIVLRSRSYMHEAYFSIDDMANSVATILEIVIGVWLIMGQPSILRLIARLRKA